MDINTNGNGKPAEPILANLIIPGAQFADSAYASLKLRLDCYNDFILAQKYKDGQGGGFYALDPTDVAAALAGVTLGTPLLPPGCLFWQRPGDGGERLAIYVGPRVWQVNVSADPSTGSGRGKRQRLAVPMPGLVWIGQGTSYRLYAVKSGGQGSGVGGQGSGVRGWPTAETELWRAPCPNVSDNICRGNVEFPAASAETIWQALELFFESDFNDHLSNGKSRDFPKSVLDAWRELAGAGAEAWPEDDLVSAETTLGKVRER